MICPTLIEMVDIEDPQYQSEIYSHSNLVTLEPLIRSLLLNFSMMKSNFPQVQKSLLRIYGLVFLHHLKDDLQSLSILRFCQHNQMASLIQKKQANNYLMVHGDSGNLSQAYRIKINQLFDFAQFSIKEFDIFEDIFR